jgi:hypothetical protein
VAWGDPVPRNVGEIISKLEAEQDCEPADGKSKTSQLTEFAERLAKASEFA